VKRQEMQRSMWHEHYVLAGKAFADRRDQLPVQTLQMAQCCAQQGLREPICICRAHAKLRELKAQQVQQVGNAGHHAHWHNLNALGSDHCREQPVARGVILHQHHVRGQAGLQLRQGKIHRRL
jgi:hypothetical protein